MNFKLANYVDEIFKLTNYVLFQVSSELTLLLKVRC